MMILQICGLRMPKSVKDLEKGVLREYLSEKMLFFF